MASVELHIRIDNTYIPILSIPVDDCNRFALNPLRWLRFLGYAIYGSQGHISATADGPLVDYESAVEGGAHYYFTSAAAPRLLDVRCTDNRTSDAETTESRAGFRANLQGRDGSCIVTNAPPLLCVGAHIYPHSKGSEYLSRLMANRGDGLPNIDDINDIRNGLLLVQVLHTVFGLGQVAFLKTPNFAMNDDDIPPSPGPILGPPSASPGRFILQHFTPQHEYIKSQSPHNQDARLPADMSQFPPSIIVDMFYGCAAVLRWGILQAADAIELSVGSLYYDETGSGESNSSGEAGDGTDDIEAARSPTPVETPRSKRAKAWASRHCDQSEPRLRTIDEAMDLVMLLWSRSGPKHQEKPPPTQEEDSRQDRVHAWLQTQ